MAMDLRNPDVWLAHLLENLPEDKLSAALDDGNADWSLSTAKSSSSVHWRTASLISRNFSAGA